MKNKKSLSNLDSNSTADDFLEALFSDLEPIAKEVIKERRAQDVPSLFGRTRPPEYSSFDFKIIKSKGYIYAWR